MGRVVQGARAERGAPCGGVREDRTRARVPRLRATLPRRDDATEILDRGLRRACSPGRHHHAPLLVGVRRPSALPSHDRQASPRGGRCCARHRRRREREERGECERRQGGSSPTTLNRGREGAVIEDAAAFDGTSITAAARATTTPARSAARRPDCSAQRARRSSRRRRGRCAWRTSPTRRVQDTRSARAPTPR